ncbi:hypothetical protein CKO42_23215 [Lamprobacter modestohalophilus]|uniref:Uncharacterized protein n=1 Tax=Lamprobacter modestohalophilus TaxID=1064514 RepID=A0A9X0WE02_9GAMM|nr:hypothetical protein [Lamprobacter modestohalophilus]
MFAWRLGVLEQQLSQIALILAGPQILVLDPEFSWVVFEAVQCDVVERRAVLANDAGSYHLRR